MKLRKTAPSGATTGVIVLLFASCCVLPAREVLPEIRGQLLDSGASILQARVGYSRDWREDACDEQLKPLTLPEGRFHLRSQSSWSMKVITPFPDYGRPGWQLCFESPDGRRRYYRTWNRGGTADLVCDLGRLENDDVCTPSPR